MRESINYKLSVYKITDTITFDFSQLPPVTGSSFLDAVFSFDGSKIYVVGGLGAIYSIDASDKTAVITV